MQAVARESITMTITLPHKIENGHGETLIFQEIIEGPDGDKVLTEGFCRPGAGPPMHVHFRQDEGFTVVSGRLAYQTPGEPAAYLTEGQSVMFPRNHPHRFWNAGETELHIQGWVKPANSLIFFLTALYAAQRRSGNARPEAFDAAYLMTRYRSEYDLLELPWFVKRIVMPLTYAIGMSLRKYDKFKDAPPPL